MKKLNEADLIRIMKEEWQAKVKALSEEVDLAFTSKVDGEEKMVLSPELKVRNKVKVDPDDETPDEESGESKDEKDGEEKVKGYLYTVKSISPRDVVLLTPDGELIHVSKEELEKNYELD